MPFSLTTSFPLGFYQGHDATGEPELYPTPNRLYSALVSAAFGTCGSEVSLEAALDAITWMEGNPPDAVSLPHAVPAWRNSPTAYREKGLASRNAKNGEVSASKKESARATAITAVDGPLTYWWKIEPTPQQVESLDALAYEVAYIGERNSVAHVCAQVQDSIPKDALPLSKNHLLPDRLALRMEYPEIGRLKELSDAYSSAYPHRSPSSSSDRPGSAEKEKYWSVPRTFVGVARYRLPDVARKDAPWTRGFLVEMDPVDREGSPAPNPALNSERLPWCVTLHRTIVKRIGFGAPAMVTGVYSKEMPVPANHMAIQIVSTQMRQSSSVPGDKDAFVVMFPAEATAAEIDQVRQALSATRKLYSGARGEVKLGSPLSFDPTGFWNPPSQGLQRLWEPVPAAICEIRGGQRGPRGGKWTLGDALVLAAGFVWRERIAAPKDSGLPLYQEIVRRAESIGISAKFTRRLHPRDISNYVHRRSNNDVIAQADGLLDLSPVCSGTQLAAVGQSRHLGGGLLIPWDGVPDQNSATERHADES